MELVEQLGSGMNRMMQSYSPDIFKISPNFFHVILFYSKMPNGGINGTLKFSDSEMAVLEEMKKNPYITMDETVKNTGLSRRTVARTIKSFQNNKIIVRIGSKKTGHWEIVQEQLMRN